MAKLIELCREFHLSPRTIGRYVQLGIIDPPHPRAGRGAEYPPDSFERIRKARGIVLDARETYVDLAQRPMWWRQPRQTS